MTTVVLVLPYLAACALTAAVVAALHRRLPPVLATRLLAFVLTVLTVAALPTVWIVSVAYLVHLPAVHAALGWCAVHIGHHAQVAAPIGLLATGAAVYGTMRAAKVVRSYRRLRCDIATGPEIAPHPEPFAFTLPGPGGHVVLSSALIELLTADERAVVLAHEQAHARCRHDRYLLLARAASAAVPILRPLATRLEFALERWADEHAVARCGDRRLVATTLGKVALNAAPLHGALAFHNVGIAGRVHALLAPPVRLPRRWVRFAGLVATAAMVLCAAYQVHHAAIAVLRLCAT